MSYGHFGTYRGDTTIQDRAQVALDELEREVAPKSGISFPLSYGAKGIEVGVLQQALVDLGYLAPTYGAQGKSSVDSDYGKLTGKALEAFLAAAGVPCSSSSSSKGCKQLGQAGAQAIDVALRQKGTSTESVVAKAKQEATAAGTPPKTCTQSLPAWKAVAIGAGLMPNPCPPPGQSTQASPQDTKKAQAAACEIYKRETTSKILLTGGLGIVSGALLGLMFAEDKKNGAMLGAVAVGLLAGGSILVLKPGKPEGC